MILFKLIHESFLFAVGSLVVNKVRTILSLLGITIGIFSIIAVFTVFDNLENSIKTEINSLGNDVLFIQKWPWAMGGGDYPWWKYLQRPEPRFREMDQILKRSNTVDKATYMFNVSRNVYYRNNVVESVQIMAVSQDYIKVMPLEIGDGRYFTEQESHSAKNVAILGYDIAKNLFGGSEVIGKRVKIFGRKLDVIGVVKRKGDDIFGSSPDKVVYVPAEFAKGLVDYRHIGSSIIVKAKSNVGIDEMKDELTGIMRSIRKLKPAADDDFALNQTDVISKGFDQLFGVISIVGWIIGGFSLLVGGFGIANIMFVSVKERTNQIGIQKALGAKNYFILLQFLFEAVFLSLMGGVVGLLLVLILTWVMSGLFDFSMTLSMKNIVLGLSVSALIGFVSGFIPSWSASRLDPVEAMRSNF
jgi:putative ABC transport system permease protein